MHLFLMALPCMSPRISENCALVLLLAMSLALGVGLLAWGPITLTPADHQFADQQMWAGIPNARNALSCLPLLAVGLWGLLATLRSHWPASMRAPWFGFFALAALHAGTSSLYHLAPNDVGYALSHWFVAGAFTLLLLGFLAERIHPLYGSRSAIAAGVGIATLAALWWTMGQGTTGAGDLRAMLLLEYLPLLLIPAGALNVPGQFTPRGDWLWMLGGYALARAAGLADAALFDAMGWISGHALMHLLLAWVTACLAYRASASPRVVESSLGVLGEPTHRSVSLNTSS